LVSLSFLPSSNVPLSLPPFFLLPSRFSSVPLSLLPSPTLHMATRGPMTGFLCRAFSPIDACLQLYGAQGSRGTQGSRVLAYRDSRVSRGKSSDASLMCPGLASHVSRLHRKPCATLEEWQSLRRRLSFLCFNFLEARGGGRETGDRVGRKRWQDSEDVLGGSEKTAPQPIIPYTPVIKCTLRL